MKVKEELNNLNIYRCPECRDIISENWEYKDFSNKTIAVCPNCNCEIYINDLLEGKNGM